VAEGLYNLTISLGGMNQPNNHPVFCPCEAVKCDNPLSHHFQACALIWARRGQKLSFATELKIDLFQAIKIRVMRLLASYYT
jgi:hypothetical protein